MERNKTPDTENQVEIRVPALGESIVDAVIATWLKNEGDEVKQGEALVELETDKVNVEVSAEQGGILQKILKQAGDVVGVGDVLCMVGENDRITSSIPQETSVLENMPDRQSSNGQQQGASQKVDGQKAVSPLARRIADDYNIDLSRVTSHSSHGRVTKDDVISYLEQAAAQQTPDLPMVTQQSKATDVNTTVEAARKESASDQTRSKVQIQSTSGGREEHVRLSRRRQTIAQRLVEAQHTTAMLTTFNEVDMSAVMEVRARRKDTFKERHGISLGFMSFFTKAVVGALKAFPRLNAEIRDNEMILKYYYDIGIAVGAEEGLVVPVLRDADRRSFAEIESEIANLAKKARENKLTLAELQGGTFTITNGGVFGSLLSTPILNAPQVGILGMHKIEQRPVVVDGQIAIRSMMYLALSYDHRIVDGREAVQFLVKVKEFIEDPETLLLEG
ncbi:MAG: 2-oxoglutarate dehydrogenase complex dihydrolipoyllysine-residue succinyltransferase [Ktedonobacteraceae bacterium]